MSPQRICECVVDAVRPERRQKRSGVQPAGCRKRWTGGARGTATVLVSVLVHAPMSRLAEWMGKKRRPREP